MFSTERFESFNGVFRECSVYSNRSSPSRDIAHTFAQFDCTKHIFSGGYWYDKHRKHWVTAGSAVLDEIGKRASLARLLGLPSGLVSPETPGAITLFPINRKVVPRSRPPPIQWQQTLAAKADPHLAPQIGGMTSLWDLGKRLVADNGDGVKVGSHVLVKTELVAYLSFALTESG
jgi:hypothetical protein